MNRTLMAGAKKSSSDDNLIPLINIVFLLLIFFMVAGQLKTAQSGAVQLPSSAHTTTSESQSIKIIINAQGEIFLNQADSDSTPISPQALSEYISNQSDPSPTSVSLYADRDLTAAQLHLALNALGSHPTLNINLHTRKGGEE